MSTARVTFLLIVPASHEVGCAPEDAVAVSAQDPSGLGGLHSDLERMAAALSERGGEVRLASPVLLPLPGDLSIAIEALRRLVGAP